MATHVEVQAESVELSRQGSGGGESVGFKSLTADSFGSKSTANDEMEASINTMIDQLVTFTASGDELCSGSKRKMSTQLSEAGQDCKTVQPRHSDCRLFLGSIPKSMSKAELRTALAMALNGVTDVIVHSIDGNLNRGFCFVDFDSKENAKVALSKLKRSQVMGCQVVADWADPQVEPDETTMASVKVLYVRNLVKEVTENELRTTFSVFGAVERIRRIKDYAFVEFENRDDAIQAMVGLDGSLVRDRTVNVALAKPPIDRTTREAIMRNREKRIFTKDAQSTYSKGYPNLPLPPTIAPLITASVATRASLSKQVLTTPVLNLSHLCYLMKEMTMGVNSCRRKVITFQEALQIKKKNKRKKIYKKIRAYEAKAKEDALARRAKQTTAATQTDEPKKEPKPNAQQPPKAPQAKMTQLDKNAQVFTPQVQPFNLGMRVPFCSSFSGQFVAGLKEAGPFVHPKPFKPKKPKKKKKPQAEQLMSQAIKPLAIGPKALAQQQIQAKGPLAGQPQQLKAAKNKKKVRYGENPMMAKKQPHPFADGQFLQKQQQQ